MKMFVDVPAIYLHRDPVDFRKAVNGLALIVEQQMALSPFSDALFVFCNKAGDKVKVLYWDKTGFCLWYKRLEAGTFEVLDGNEGQASVQIDATELTMLLSGVSLRSVKRRKRYAPAA